MEGSIYGGNFHHCTQTPFENHSDEEGISGPVLEIRSSSVDGAIAALKRSLEPIQGNITEYVCPFLSLISICRLRINCSCRFTLRNSNRTEREFQEIIWGIWRMRTAFICS